MNVQSTIQTLRPYAPLLLRLAFAYELYDAAGHTALHPAEGVPGYAEWLKSLGFPFPLVSAALSAYAEFIGAILMVLGYKTRWAAVVLLINFSLAILVGHVAIGDTYKNAMPAINLFAMSVFLLLNGPGKPSIDEGL
ncbi:DoxX family protein [Fibrisoma montanum]|uniref:DoxX family protein n=1 Tax=Fibrisoma montanum TaxID=2305895 RepID=A0A418LXT4_9BACT|nr:DoxX family protein [Fibrisoma montanum]RIV18081.1 DoxX family protein [Fibrisoma montanum]